jgi:hypothetical protein
MERKALMEITDALRSCILEPVLAKLIATGELADIARRVKSREADPYTEAETVAHRFLNSGETL